MPEYQRAKTLSVYLSMPGKEIATASIVHDAFAQNKAVFVPFIHKLQQESKGQPTSVMEMVELKSVEDFQSLEQDNWGIPTPSKDSIPTRRNCFGGMGTSPEGTGLIDTETTGLDMVIMPGVAFDHKLGRLGHGKGFYDFFLARCENFGKLNNRAAMPFLGKKQRLTSCSVVVNATPVGLALNEQVLPEEDTVPMDSSDWRIDALITGDGKLIRARGPSH